MCNQLRVGAVKEMQNRQPIDPAQLEACLFGVPVFLKGGPPLVLPERKNRALLSYLVLTPGIAHSRDRLVELIWPRSTVFGGRASLRQALSGLRSALNDPDSRLLVASRDTVSLEAAGVRSDAGFLDGLLSERGTGTHAGPDLRGPFLDGLTGISAEFDNWRAAEEARLSALSIRYFCKMAETAEADHHLADAAAFLSRALELDPMDEALTRHLMQVHVRLGHSAKALGLFRTLQMQMQSDLGVMPERETQDLVREIQVQRQKRPALSASKGASSDHQPHKLVPPPQTHYAKSGDLSIAYQITGAGPVDLVYVSGWVSNLDVSWEHPVYARFLHRLGRLARVIRFDKRGTGLSDRNVGYPTLEQRMDDVRAVMDAAGSQRAVLFGTSEGGNLCMLFAATYPERTAGLILYGAFARGLWAKDYPWAKTITQVEAELAEIERDWGSAFDLSNGAPSLADDPTARNWFAAYFRQSASPQDAIVLWRWSTEIDMRPILPAIRVPTLVIHRSGDRWVKIDEGRYLGKHIAGARFVELPGDDHIIWAGDTEGVFCQIEAQLLQLDTHAVETVLATLMCLGLEHPPVSREQVQSVAEIVQQEVEKSGGTLHSRGSDLFLGSFPGPTRAISCAWSIRRRLTDLMFKARASIHIGECSRTINGLEGVAVTIAERLMGFAATGNIIVSQTVRDLIVGSSLQLDKGSSMALGENGESLNTYALISTEPEHRPV